MKKSTRTFIICAVIIAVCIPVGRAVRNYLQNEPIYKAAGELMEQKLYSEAIDKLGTLPREDYKSAEALTEICTAHLRYDQGAVDDAWTSMELLEKFYNTSYLSSSQEEELRSFRKKLNNEIMDFFEQERIREQEQEAQKARSGIPYVGMPEKYIKETILGWPSSEVRHNYECIGGEQYMANLYDFKKSGAVIFTARCVQGKVIQVWDMREDPIMPRSPYRPSVSDDSDRYHLDRYNNAEDFYDDYYDDFFDYYDAEDYFNEHKK